MLHYTGILTFYRWWICNYYKRQYHIVTCIIILALLQDIQTIAKSPVSGLYTDLIQKLIYYI